jgi:hypothetical protein
MQPSAHIFIYRDAKPGFLKRETVDMASFEAEEKKQNQKAFGGAKNFLGGQQ